jgi:hypothetical protein
MKKVIILFIVLSLSSLIFAADIGLKSIAPKLGVAMPEDLDTTFYLGLNANMGEITDNLYLYPVLGFWSSGKDSYGFDWSFSDFQLGADVHYMIEGIEGLYGGGGLSLNIFTSSVEYSYYGETYDESDSETKIGFNILGGYELPVGGKTAFAEVKYNIVEDFNTLEICIGMNFDLGK